MNDIVSSAVTVATGILGLAMVAVLVSKQAQTGSVISSVTGGFAQDISAAVSPLSGGGFGGFTGSGTTTF